MPLLTLDNKPLVLKGDGGGATTLRIDDYI